MTASRAGWWAGLLFGARAAVAVYGLGESLTPDTALYARGAAWWSSPVTGLVGYGWSLRGVQLLAVCSSTALGIVLGRRSGLRRSVLVWASPPGWYLMQAGADALGVLVLLWVWGRDGRPARTVRAVVLCCAGHLVVGLELVVYVAYRRLAGATLPWLGFLVAGVGACLGEWHVQVRYFLPAVCVWAVTGR